MRIRRYAARLLASSAPASNSGAGAAAAAPWLHAAADDCAFCELTRGSGPQVAPDGVQRKGHVHIAGLETEGELLKSDDLARRPPVLEELIPARAREIDHERSTGEDAARPESQVASDRIKHKMHIAGREQEGELESDEGVDLPHTSEESVPPQRCDIDYQHSTSRDVAVTGAAAARPESQVASDRKMHIAGQEQERDLPQQPHTSEGLIPAQRCEIDYEHCTSKDVAGLQATGGADLRLECTRGTTIVSEEATEPAVNKGAFVADEATDDQEAGETSILLNGSVTEFEPEVAGAVSLASGSIVELDITMGASCADKAVAEREVSEGVSLASEAATEPADAVTASGARTGTPLNDEGVAEQVIKMGDSSVDESTAEMDIIQIDSFVSEAATHPGLPERVSIANENAMQQEVSEGVSPASERTTGAPLDDIVVAEPDIKMGASPVDESTAEMDIMQIDSFVSEAATHPGLPERGSLANENDMQQEVSEGVSPASEAGTEPTDAVTALEVTTGASLDDKGLADTDIRIRASSVNEFAAEMDFTGLGSVGIEAATHPGLPERVSLASETATERDVSEGVSPASEAATEPADIITALKVTAGAPLEDKVVADVDIKMGASSVNESAVEMDFTPSGSLVIEAATHPGLPERVSLANENATEQGVSEGVLLVRETSTKSADVVTTSGVTTGAPLDNEGISEQDIKMGASPVDESSDEIDVIRLGSLVEAAIDPGLPESGSLANKTATEREVSKGVSLVTEAAAEPADVVTALEITTGAPLDSERAAEPETKMGACLVNESTAEIDCGCLGSLVIETTTHTGLAERVSLGSEVVTKTGVAGTANLDTEVSVKPEATGGPSLLNEYTDPETTGRVSIAMEAAAEPEVTGKASACSEDGGAALNETHPLDCDVDCATVQIENVGVSVANKVQPSRDDADAADEVVSVSSTSIGPVRDKSPAADEVTPHDDTPSVSCVSGIVARSVGKSGRTDIICYARRIGKRKLDMADMKTYQTEMGDSDICDQSEEKATLDRTAPCESAMSTAGSAEIKLADIKRGLKDNSASTSSRCKRRKGRYECDITYCRMTFKKKAELSVHKKNMCTVKSCGKHFRSHKYLRRHLSIHNEDTPYKCPWEDCTLAFKWTWSLTDHFQVHTGEKPYRCKTPGCSKIYKYVSDFIRHKKRCKSQR